MSIRKYIRSICEYIRIRDLRMLRLCFKAFNPNSAQAFPLLKLQHCNHGVILVVASFYF